jgi:thiamine biosynthesis protein ThiI
MPISPLIGFEKQETIQLARKIGTYDISISKSEGCIPPPSPRTGVSETGFKKILRESGLE